MSIFKEYDIRGLYPKELDEKTVYKIAALYSSHAKQGFAIVGRDCRLGSQSLARAAINSLRDQGVKVIDLGMVTTPMWEYASVILHAKAGIMVTASHNPKEYNGLKLLKGPALRMSYHDGLDKIDKNMGSQVKKKARRGSCVRKDILKSYVSHVIKGIKADKKQTFVLDASNGAGGRAAVMALKGLKIRHLALNTRPDGNFPAHSCNPLEKGALDMAISAVIKSKASFGAVLDGDADRVIFIDDKGKPISPDIMLGIISRFELKKHPGKIVYYDLRSTKQLPQIIHSHGGREKISRVGAVFLKEKLRKRGGLIAGELSGHIMYSENFGIDDGLYCFAKAVSYFSSSHHLISELAKPMKRYYESPEISIKVKSKDRAIAFIKRKYSQYRHSYLDGITVYSTAWWFNLRKSNTEPLVRLKIEAHDSRTLSKMEKKLQNEIKTL